MGAEEMAGSLSKSLYLASPVGTCPRCAAADLERAPAGVRAQAVDRDGGLVDDFRISRLGQRARRPQRAVPGGDLVRWRSPSTSWTSRSRTDTRPRGLTARRYPASAAPPLGPAARTGSGAYPLRR